MRLVLDTCVLVLATLPAPRNKAAFIWELCRRNLFQVYVSPDTLAEYQRVLFAYPRFLLEIQAVAQICYPLFSVKAVRHEPDNRFLEVALAAEADYLITVNTAPGHFDRKRYESVRVVTPGEFLQEPRVSARLRELD
ncbi:MAG: PIN domain-containing protein [Verrucomicrobiae bacterium]|nr:PIN domain-containing protein [Verrucomicrobiae bacterium]